MTEPDLVEQQQSVYVQIDENTHATSVRLEGSWRREIGSARLGAAVLTALTTAMQRHLLAALEAGPPDVPPPTEIPGTPQERNDFLRRAIRDLDEFRIALTELTTVEKEIQDPSRHITVTVRQNDVAGIDVDAEWVDRVRDGAVEQALGAALSAALTHIATTPNRALYGCPDLQKILWTSGSPLATAERKP